MVTKQAKKIEEKVMKPHANKPAHFEGRFKQGRGGRKTATAQVRLYPKATGVVVNGKDHTVYFQQLRHQLSVVAPLEITETKSAFGVSALVVGGGITGQADAVRHGIARALIAQDPTFRKALKREGFLTRDPRAVERKKYGLKKARRAPQWAKR